MPSKASSAPAALNSIKAEVDGIKRRRILEEAIHQFFEKGYEATSVESIADGLGVTKQFIYSRFHSKAELLFAVCKAGATAADRTVEFSEALNGNADARLAQIMEYFVRLQIEHRREVALYFRESSSLPPEEAREIDFSKRRFHRMLCALLNDGRSTGVFTFEDTSIAASALGGMASWAFTWFQPEGRWDADSVARQLATLALKTVGAATEAPAKVSKRG